MSHTICRIWVRFTDQHGAGMVEYALLVALIAIALVAAVAAFGTGLWNSFSDSATEVVNVGTT